MTVQRITNYGGAAVLLDELLALLDRAERKIWVKVAWWDSSADASRILKSIVAAHSRGLDVLVLIRPETSNDGVLRALREAGVRVEAVRYIHEKELIVDDVALVHSMNFTEAEITRNQNSGFVHNDPQVVEAVELGFISMMANIEAAQVGDEVWTPTTKLVPEEWLRYLKRDELNPLQSKAVPTVLSASGHVMVVAPTSSGKTLIGEVAVLRSILIEHKPAVWLVPARALAAEFGETTKLWEKHGIRSVMLTGETNMSSDAVRSAHLWIATTEKFESLYRRSSLRTFIANVGCLVIDEVHLVGDPERGATLESLIARLRLASERTRIVALSATVANADELAEWFDAQLVQSRWRPTVLTTELVTYEAEPADTWAEKEAAKDAVLLALLRDVLKPDSGDHGSEERTSGNYKPSALIFCAAKNATHKVASLVADVVWTSSMDKAENIDKCFAHGVGIHYRDAHEMRRALADFRSQKIQVLAATSGLSTGVNTPARAVIIRDLVLGKDTPLEVSQAQQMLGRAGRTGQGSKEGFGFVLVPKSEANAWRIKLSDGYTTRSRVLDSLADCLLAELLLGSVTTRESAESWFRGTLAFAQGGDERAIGDALDSLIMRGFVSEIDGAMAPTEIGSLTSRLMIDVESAGALLAVIPELQSPNSAREAEEVVLCALATRVTLLRDWPVNSDTYKTITSALLFNWSTRVVTQMGAAFGSQFCLAAAQMALREPDKLRSRHPNVSIAEFKHAVEAMPRYLAWMAALGYTESLTWVPAVAGELARRLTWWDLRPHPQLGSGRLLWMLESMIEPQNRAAKMPDLWERARTAGFDSPDEIRARPNRVDCTSDEFAHLTQQRADISVSPPERGEVAVTTDATSSRLTALTSRGNRTMISTSRPVHGRFELPAVPGSLTDLEIASDFFLYSKGGDFAYDNLKSKLALEDVVEVDPVEEARQLSKSLPDSVVVQKRRRGLKGLVASEHKKQVQMLLPLIAPDSNMNPVAVALAEHETDPIVVVCHLRENLVKMLDTPWDGPERPAARVLLTGQASKVEIQLTMVALLSSLHIETGVATSADGLVALVRLGQEWKLAMPTPNRNTSISAVIPKELPAVVDSVRRPPASADTPAHPRFEWVRDFLNG